MKKFFTKLKSNFVHQIFFAVLLNPLIYNFFKGKIYQGELKQYCLPVLNCYSCPAAVTACPIGSFQHMLSNFKYHFSFWIAGIFGVVGITAGSWFCGHACPFGLFQDLLNKLSNKNFTMPRILRYIKYPALIFLVILLPLLIKKPTFCSYLCPAGTLQAGLTLVWFNSFNLGFLYFWKISLLALFTFSSIAYKRPFCNTSCPIGLVMGWFNKISIYQLEVDNSKCIECDICREVCPADIYIYKNPKNTECVRCNKCIEVCPTNAIKLENKLLYKKGDDYAKSN
ncbi:MAG: 4Fe-4S binding protein [Candidatus Mcinerneyibacterium aminivorans]|uniref:4Fe-4S binding protein n=1 Tax=Candidatus Mcinerneyibacterium aminivorans TaxID=2703815 RepID=A0A5D0MJ95_9BACT|nr:MAG: 4Fe-4S binding protein [Candidatus Mcinerneyibacterium aminivorans]